VYVAVWGTRRLRRAIGSEPAVVYRGEVEPGQTIEIRHLTETYGGKRVRRR
jgi:ribosomal protein L25 (general stress protein Ctc)